MDEWAGLIKAQQLTVAGGAAQVAPGEREREWRVVQMAEPFDGTHKAELLAPLLAWHIQVCVCACTHAHVRVRPSLPPSLPPPLSPPLAPLPLSLSYRHTFSS